jgi:hypothetical protein
MEFIVILHGRFIFHNFYHEMLGLCEPRTTQTFWEGMQGACVFIWAIALTELSEQMH